MGRHPKHNARANSKASFYEWEKKCYGERSKAVIWLIKTNGQMTVREILNALGKSDFNYIRPTISLMVKEKKLFVVGLKWDKFSRRHVSQFGLEERKGPPVFGQDLFERGENGKDTDNKT